jgi:Bacterial Ig-like domain
MSSASAASAKSVAIDQAYRFASRTPALEISGSDPVDSATGVPVNKTISLTFSLPLSPQSVSDATITITPNVSRTTSLNPINHRIVDIDPTGNLQAITSYQVTMTTGLRATYGAGWTVTPTASDSISFTTA